MPQKRYYNTKKLKLRAVQFGLVNLTTKLCTQMRSNFVFDGNGSANIDQLLLLFFYFGNIFLALAPSHEIDESAGKQKTNIKLNKRRLKRQSASEKQIKKNAHLCMHVCT